jgi:error-prone DNA polymerase
MQPVQLALDLGDAPDETMPAGLAEMTGAERVRAELEVLGLDASRHVLEFYEPLLDGLGVTRSRDLLQCRSRADLLVAGVKVATQTPPIRSGRRVVFLTLDDATGPVDATFFEDVQGPYAATVFHSWLLVVRGVLRRTGPRGVSLRATGAWELPVLWDAWTAGGMEEVRALLETAPGWTGATEGAVSGAAASRSSRPVLARPPVADLGGGINPPYDRAAEEAASGLPVGDRGSEGRGRGTEGRGRAGGMGGGAVYRRVFIDYATGYRQSPYADVGTPGDHTRDTRRMTAAETSQDRADQREAARREAARREAARQEAVRREAARQEAARSEGRGTPPRKLWHASPGSSGR